MGVPPTPGWGSHSVARQGLDFAEGDGWELTSRSWGPGGSDGQAVSKKGPYPLAEVASPEAADQSQEMNRSLSHQIAQRVHPSQALHGKARRWNRV